MEARRYWLSLTGGDGEIAPGVPLTDDRKDGRVVAIPETIDHTLASADTALVTAQDRRHRPYLGMSALGAECARKLWYEFRWASLRNFDAPTLKRFADGHATEAVAVARLKLAEGIELHEADESGKQFGFIDFGGHLRGHMDGVVLGLQAAPSTWHVLEIKATAEDKLRELEKLRREVGEKQALKAWNPVYYAQAILYMFYAGLERHYLVACSPGARRWAAVRTDADPAEVERLLAKAGRIIHADHAPERIGGPDSFICKWCDFFGVCHEGVAAERNCRTCLSVTPERDGCWSCARWEFADLPEAAQAEGCPHHLFIPSLVPGEQIDATESSVTYRMPDGSTWIDGRAA